MGTTIMLFILYFVLAMLVGCFSGQIELVKRQVPRLRGLLYQLVIISFPKLVLAAATQFRYVSPAICDAE